MKAAEPSRGCDRVHGRGCDGDAPAAEAKRMRDAQRVRRYRDRKARCEAVGRFTITEDLVTALIMTGDLSERDATTKEGIEEAVDKFLRRVSRTEK